MKNEAIDDMSRTAGGRMIRTVPDYIMMYGELTEDRDWVLISAPYPESTSMKSY